MTGKPDVWWSMPHIADPYWDALWSLATELEMSISFHAGGSDPTNDIAIRGYHGLPPRTRFTANAIPIFFGNAQPIVDLIFGGVVERFPRLKFVIVESGLGWISFLLELMDYQFHEHRVREVSPELVLDPSEYFRRQIYTTFWFERVGVERLIDHVGLNNVMFETDFPHPTSLWPPTSAREQAEQCAAAHPVEIRERILWRNAAELYGLSMPVASAAR
jgi:predicted TIM-barrel fold metal-dependent hydrolase